MYRNIPEENKLLAKSNSLFVASDKENSTSYDNTITKIISNYNQNTDKIKTQETFLIKEPSHIQRVEHSLEDIKKSIESYFKELQDQGYVFQDESKIIAKTRNFNRIFDTDSQDFLFYKDLVEQYNKADKLVDEYGRVFFYIPGLSDALLSNSSELQSYHYLLQIYRKWLSGLYSFEVEIRNDKPFIINELGNRSFIYGDKESIDKEQHKFTKDYKTSPDNFHVVLDINNIVYFSDIPFFYEFSEYDRCRRVVENIRKKRSGPCIQLPVTNIASTIINNEEFFNNYREKGDKYMCKYDPKFLNTDQVLPKTLHRFSTDILGVSREIKFNARDYEYYQKALLFFDQEKFDKIADELNFLSQEKVFNKCFGCKEDSKQFQYDYLKLKQKQLRDNGRNYFWHVHLSDSLYLETNIIKDILSYLNERKDRYVKETTYERQELSQVIQNYINVIINLCEPEEARYYKYFMLHEPQNSYEKERETRVFDKIESLLKNTKCSDLQHVEDFIKIKKSTGIFNNTGQEYKLSRIIEDNPDISLLELMSYSVLAYIDRILKQEINNSLNNTKYKLIKENYFLEKILEEYLPKDKKQASIDILLDPEFNLFSDDFSKLNDYITIFCNSNIIELSKYKYMVSRLLTIIESNHKNQKTILNDEINKRISNAVEYYASKIRILEDRISRDKSKSRIDYLPYDIHFRNRKVTEEVFRLQAMKELDDLLTIEEEIYNETIFKRPEKYRAKAYKQFLDIIKAKNTLVIYNHASEIDKTKMSRESCNKLDESLMQPGYSYCYNRSLENFNKGDLIGKVHTTIQNNDNIHIVGVNDGTADAQYILGFIADILHTKYKSGKNYNGQIFIELYNPVGIAEKLSREIDQSLKSLKLKNNVIINIINEITNKSIVVGKCIGIDYGIDKMSDTSLFLVKNRLLNSLNSHVGYKLPHYYQTCKEDCYYFKLSWLWKEYRKYLWGIEDDTIPTVHCMKRIAELRYVNDNKNFLRELYNDFIYDKSLHESLLKLNSGKHYTIDEIKDYLIYAPFLKNKIERLKDDEFTNISFMATQVYNKPKATMRF